jgi:hypoxanthine phosphoribosyltransferase
MKDKRVRELIIPAAKIRARVRALGGEISRDYRGRDLLLLGILRGSLLFMADLMRAIKIPLAIDFMAITGYGGGKGAAANQGGGVKGQTKVVRVVKDLEEDLAGKDVLLVEDIVDTGLTLGYLMPLLQARGPASLHICTLLDRSFMRIVPLPIRYRGFELPDVFVVGYGLDWKQRYRNLPSIYRLAPE